MKFISVSLLTLFIFQSNLAQAFDYTVLRDQNKPANPKVLESTAKTMETTGLVSLETDGFGEIPIEWVDQIWANPTMEQAIFLKFDLKPKDESLLGKTIKMKTALLIHGRQDSGAYFAAYFSGFDEKSVQTYYQKILHGNSKSAKNVINEIFTVPSAYAEQTNSCGDGKKAGMFKGLFSVVNEYKWTCLKSFVKVAFGSILLSAASKVLSVLDGSIWNNVGTNWGYITSVIGAISRTTKSLKDLDFLPLKTRTEYICETLGKAANAASGSLSSGVNSANVTAAANRIVDQVFNHKMDAKYKKIIEKNKIKNQTYSVCTKPSTKNKKSPVPGASAAASSGFGIEGATKSGKSATYGK